MQGTRGNMRSKKHIKQIKIHEKHRHEVLQKKQETHQNTRTHKHKKQSIRSRCDI